MSTYKRWVLPPEARSVALEQIRNVHGQRIFLYAAVVMPDHAHMLFSPLLDASNRPYSLPEIMQALRGPSAHAINKALHRTGKVWEEEFFDRLVRHGEFEKTLDYICLNPVRKRLVQYETEYPWLWVEPVY